MLIQAFEQQQRRASKVLIEVIITQARSLPVCRVSSALAVLTLLCSSSFTGHKKRPTRPSSPPARPSGGICLPGAAQPPAMQDWEELLVLLFVARLASPAPGGIELASWYPARPSQVASWLQLHGACAPPPRCQGRARGELAKASEFFASPSTALTTVQMLFWVLLFPFAKVPAAAAER